MRKASRRTLSLVLSFLMTLSVGVCDFSLVTFAKEESTKTNQIWTSINFEDISENDSIAITMTKGEKTYVLPNAEATNSGPKAVSAKEDKGVLTFEGDIDNSDYAWTITKNTVETKTVKDDENGTAPNSDEPTNSSLSSSTEENADDPSIGDSGDDDKKQTGETSEGEYDKKNSDENVGDDKTPADDKSGDKKSENTENGNSQLGANSGAGEGIKGSEGDGKKPGAETDEKGVTTPANGNAGMSLQNLQGEPATELEEKDSEEESDDTVTETYYTITSGENHLYTNADNNGVRVKNIDGELVGAKWIIEDGYLCAKDSKGDVRYLGVYEDKSDFRAYAKDSSGAFPNNIKNQTLKFYKLTDGAGVLAPEASVKSGEEVDYDTEITLTCATEDATIYYNTNDTENYSPYEEPIKVNKDLTIHAYAQIGEEETGEKSEKVSFEYTLKKGVKIKDLSSLIDGQEFVLVHDDKESMSSLPGSGNNNKKLDKVDVEINEDGYLVYKDSEAKLATLKLEKSDNEDQFYITTELLNEEGEETSTCYLTTGATGNSLTFEKNKSDSGLDLWKFEDLEDGSFLIKSVKAEYHDKKTNVDKPQYIEYYNKFFTAYSYTDDSDKAPYTLSAYTIPDYIDGEDTQEDDENTIAKLLTRELYDGDEIVVYYPRDNKFMSSDATNGKYAGVAIEPSEDGSVDIKDSNALVLEVSVDEDGKYTFKTKDDKYLTATFEEKTVNGQNKKYCGLTLLEEATANSIWKLKDADDKKEGNFNLINVNAKNGSYDLALEYYSGFTTYGIANKPEYVFNFYALKEGEKLFESDPDTELLVAQWAGNADYDAAGIEETKVINGDLYETNDMRDTKAKYSVVINGEKVLPYTKATSNQTGSTNYYMGSKGLVKGAGFIQLEFPTLGYADMNLSFRMRSSETATGEYQLQYSTTGEDGSFKDLSDGTYSYKYPVYDRNGKQSERAGDGKISDGIAKTSLAPEYFVEFSFKIPDGANNKENVYVRIVPCTENAAKNGKAAGTGGTNRIDTVQVMGHPVVSGDICGHVIADPTSGEVAEGTKVALSTKTEDAEIYYSLNGADEVKYDADKQITLTELPAIIRAHATKDGLQNSVNCVYKYTQSQVATVKATPNGGAIAQTQKITLKTKTEGATILYRYRTKAEIEKDNEKPAKEQNAQKTENPEDAENTENPENTENQDELIVTEEEDNYKDWKEYTEPFELKELPAQIQVKAVKEGCLDSAISTLKFTKRKNERENIYFGQIHAHTNISDGAGSLEDAYDHAKNVDNLDYIIITDHSNSIDNEKDSKITKNVDTKDTDEWTYAHNLAKEKSTEDFTCAYGYEMTWSNGLGHMNTFNTEGFQSRTQEAFTTYSTALENYYAALRTAPDSISQFNHPGTTFGDFQDFAYYTEENDNLITMIEVGNGEGAIGSSGYFPSYEYYIRALDKGWHVAPTNNQDNHKGLWGDANTARTVMLADENTEEAIYDAMRNYRIYATEDNDLSIYYTLDGNVMGSILDKDAVGDMVEIKADIKEPTDKAIGKVELIVNGGQVISSVDVNMAEATVKFTASSAYSYYLIKITEGDKDIAVTAPVWVGDVEACGINDVYTDTVLPVAGEPLDINVDFYNNEKTDLTINDIEIEVSDVDNKKTPVAKVSGEEAKVTEVASNGTASYKTEFVYNEAGQVTYEVTAHATLNGVEKTYKDKFTVNYTLDKMVANVIIDGSHYNDYVAGYYGGNVSAFINLCAKKNIRAKVVMDEITSEMLKDCKLLVLAAPAKKAGTANAGDYAPSHYSDEFLSLVKDYVSNGGSVIVCGLADYQDSTNGQTATEQNKLLEAIGSTIRMGSDEVWDDTNNGGQQYRMYPKNFNLDSDLLAGIREGQVYSQYSGCSVDISSATATGFVDAAEWLVKGFETTLSMDCKGPNGEKYDANNPLDNMGDVTFIARQKTKAGGQIIVAGGVFLSDFEVKAEMDNNDSLPYANHTIVNNILDGAEVQLETTTIAEARKGKMNDIFAVEGYVTSGTDNPDTTFFDTIYIQDETGGMDIFPYATPGLKIGTKMRIVGFLAQYQGDIELKVLSAKVLDDAPYVWQPKVVDTKTAMDYDNLGGQLLQTTGKVTKVDYNSDGTVAEFWLKDSTGKEAAIFIDGYIKSGTTGKNTLSDFVKKGANVTAAGVLYKHPEGKSDVSVPVFRVRNCDDIFLAKESASGNQGGGNSSGQDSSDNGSTNSGSSHDNGVSGSDSNGSDTSNTSSSTAPNTGAATAASSGASSIEAATASSSGTGEQITTGQPGSTGTDSSHSNGGGNAQQDNAGEGGNSQASEGDNSGNGDNQNPGQGVQVQAGDDEQIGEQVTTPEKPKPHIPVVPVAVGFGIISVAVVTIVVVKVTVGTSLAASAASGSKLAGLLVKLLKIFGK
ncbi:hypothetical protein D6853_12810 [Butyrivibrio sp. X503]|uniref:CehA/McbA family metallohydrolase n=1 Tax=Butyrivibrio sp. X503 TaxID=2364878 RepID=UPI000EAA5AFA|nr:CehA/McbA family metallohydrolase [Butyrivibrio sp. X503]RKM54713.1 hypothetical protein D6853_12810 [Butyrivibrio sp. X503]